VAGFLGAGRVTIDHAGRKQEIVISVDVESDAKDFAIKVHGKLTENGATKCEKTWAEKIPRDFQ
jgi:hypothetical protein